MPTLYVSLIKTNGRTSEPVNFMRVARIGPALCMAFPLPARASPRLPLAPIGHRCHKTIMSRFRGITVLLNIVTLFSSFERAARIWYVPRRPFNVPMFNKRAGCSLFFSLSPVYLIKFRNINYGVRKAATGIYRAELQRAWWIIDIIDVDKFASQKKHTNSCFALLDAKCNIFGDWLIFNNLSISSSMISMIWVERICAIWVR